jgi:hypothetical protein
MCNHNKEFVKEHYFLKGVLGDASTPASPILYFTFFIRDHHITGTVLLSNPSFDEDIIVERITGTMQITPLVTLIQIASLKQESSILKTYLPANQRVKYVEAVIAMEKDGSGVGSFTYDYHTTENVPVQIHKKNLINKTILGNKDMMDDLKFGYLSKHRNEL